jgi:hypothetical protein
MDNPSQLIYAWPSPGCRGLVEHSGTRVEPHAQKAGVQRMNDTNTNGDRPTRVNIRRPWRQT